MVPNPYCMVDVSTPQISKHIVYPLYAQPYGGRHCCEATGKFPAFRSYHRLQLVH
jgi:hypothetical protein